MKNRMKVIIATYIISLSINLFDSIKYPDSEIGLINLILSLIFLIAVSNFLLYTLKNNYNTKIIKILLSIASISGVLIYIIVSFYDYMFDNMILDIISNIQFPLYILYITPFFGLNYIFDISYGAFSLIISIVYFIFLLSIFWKEHSN